ncbi:hypothetical protein Godav_029040 [Gossypium davidsonii]|uniref:Uncharacterized protein n=1 Tax=Gossypium davidsonii TaxID=34287 RepID=A0A7J8TJC5_GOSDV|nr:hypothetical protein [Gossypium davidsonii]
MDQNFKRLEQLQREIQDQLQTQMQEQLAKIQTIHDEKKNARISKKHDDSVDSIIGWGNR